MASELYEFVDGKLRLKFHPGQSSVWDSKARFTWMLAGTQSGKTSFGPWWLAREIYGEKLFPGQGVEGRGGGDYLAVTSTYDLFHLKLLPVLRVVFEDIFKVGKWWAGDRMIELADPETGKFWAKRADDPMWGRIILRAASASAGLESATAKAAWCDEAGQDEFTIETWEAVLRRLSLAEGRVLGTTTLYNVGWLKTEVYEPWKDGEPDVEVIQFASVLNPAFPQREFDRAKSKLPEWRFAMFYLGEFALPAGLIYNSFTDDMLVDPFAIPPDWRLVLGIDFGGANTAVLWMAEDPATEIWYVFQELHIGGLTTEEYALRVKGMTRGRASYAGGAGSEGQERRDWTAAGLNVEEPPNIGVEPGISRVIGLIKENKFRVFRTLKGLRDEIGGYRRKLDPAGDATDEILDKRKYHRLDALRYAVAMIEDSSSGGFAF